MTKIWHVKRYKGTQKMMGKIPLWSIENPGDILEVHDQHPGNFQYLRNIRGALKKQGVDISVKRKGEFVCHVQLLKGVVPTLKHKFSLARRLAELEVGQKLVLNWRTKRGKETWEPGNHQFDAFNRMRRFAKREGKRFIIVESGFFGNRIERVA